MQVLFLVSVQIATNYVNKRELIIDSKSVLYMDLRVVGSW